jgi:hypothetical protein
MTSSTSRRLFAATALVGLCASMSLGQEPTTRPTPPELGSFLALSKDAFKAQFLDWMTYDSGHVDIDEIRAELEKPKPGQKIHVNECFETADAQQQKAREFAPYADVFSYYAFVRTSADTPPEGELLWGEFDNPFINHLRQMRKLVGTTPIVAILASRLGMGPDRPAVLEEMQWQFIAAAGCGYRGVVWPASYDDAVIGEDLEQIEERMKQYGHLVARAQPVNWAKTVEGQPVSSLACDNHLFVFLLNPAYLTLGADGKTVAAPLERPLCEGVVTLTLPKGLKVRRGQTLLGGNTLRFASEDGKTAVPFSFRTGGEMMILVLSGKAGLAATTQPATTPAAMRLPNVENKQ